MTSVQGGRSATNFHDIIGLFILHGLMNYIATTSSGSALHWIAIGLVMNTAILNTPTKKENTAICSPWPPLPKIRAKTLCLRAMQSCSHSVLEHHALGTPHVQGSVHRQFRG